MTKHIEDTWTELTPMLRQCWKQKSGHYVEYVLLNLVFLFNKLCCLRYDYFANSKRNVKSGGEKWSLCGVRYLD
jgi:hypothetical protein